MTAAQPLRVALFGAGRVGSLLPEYLLAHPQAQLAYVVDPDADRLRTFRKDHAYCQAQYVTDANNVFKDETISAALLTTPTTINNELITSALNASKNVFVEKCAATEAAHVVNWYELSKKIGKQLVCGFNRRYDQCFINAYNKVKYGGLGDLHVIKTVSRDADLPSVQHLQQSGGIFCDVVAADIDLICWLAGSYPISVYATGYAHRLSVRQLGDFDTVSVTLKFKSGLIGQIDVGRTAAYGFDQRMEVVGEKGMIQVDNIPQCFTTMHTNDGHTSPKLICPPIDRYKTAYHRQFGHFFAILNGEEKASMDALNAIAVAKVTQACHTSAQSGNVVPVSI